MKNLKIYNINSKVKYKLCIGAIGLGVIATLSGNLLGNINDNLSKNNKSIYEYTEEDLDEIRAVVKLEYKNSNLITEKDNIVFIRDGKYIEDGVNLYNNDINNYTFYLTPGVIVYAQDVVRLRKVLFQLCGIPLGKTAGHYQRPVSLYLRYVKNGLYRLFLGVLYETAGVYQEYVRLIRIFRYNTARICKNTGCVL